MSHSIHTRDIRACCGQPSCCCTCVVTIESLPEWRARMRMVLNRDHGGLSHQAALALLDSVEASLEALARLERLKVITTNPEKAETCCGLPRDDDGQCINRPYHPIYVKAEA